MNLRLSFGAFIGALSSTLLPVLADATPLPAAHGSTRASYGPTTEAGGYSSPGTDPGVAFLSFENPSFVACGIIAGQGLTSACELPANPASPVAVSRVFTLTGNVGDEGNVVSDFYYYVNVDGPGSVVNVLVNSHLSTLVTLSSDPLQFGSAFAQLEIAQNNHDIVVETACTQTTQPFCISNFPGLALVSEIDFRDSISLIVGSSFIVHLETVANLGGSLAAQAFADPYFQIDPSIPNADQYHITFSEGVGNAPAPVPVPEPTSLALLGTALVVGFGLIRHRRELRKA